MNFSRRGNSEVGKFSWLSLVLAAALFAGALFVQRSYDSEKMKSPQLQFSLPPQFAKYSDLGLHSALASFLWLDTRTELPFLPFGSGKFLDDLNLINSLDPKFKTPYVYSVIVLPNTKYPGRFQDAVAIGKKGLARADTDWRIPFYTAAVYHLYLNDGASAAKYFDIAARTPGILDVVRRYGINYGISPSKLDQTIQIWLAIYQTTEDEGLRERALAYVHHFEIIRDLDEAAAAYRSRYGKFPQTLDDLVAEKIAASIPADPFGFRFFLYENGIVGIKQAAQE